MRIDNLASLQGVQKPDKDYFQKFISWWNDHDQGVRTWTKSVFGGTTTNDNASAGNVGEYIASYAAATNFPATGNWGDLTSISLTSGDWDVSVITAVFNNSATITRTLHGVGTTAGNNAPNITAQYPDDQGDLDFISGSAQNSSAGSIPGLRVSLSSTTTVYLKMQATYSAGQPQLRGRISARRVR